MKHIPALLTFTILVLSSACAADTSTLRFIENGQPRARIVIPGKQSEAATLLADTLFTSTGARLPIVQESAAPLAEDGTVEIHIGGTRYVRGLGELTSDLHPHGFVIAFPDAKHVVLHSSSTPGLAYAAGEFLERYAGVRWLFPGAMGEHVPRAESLTVPAVDVRSQPGYHSRVLSGMGRDLPKEQSLEHRAWAKRMRMGGEVEFHHNLFQLFPPKVYGETHPQFFPEHDGKRRVIHARLGWQPCFTAEGLANEAARRIIEHFDKPPRNKTSYSLGVNDSAGYCECAACRAKHSRAEGSDIVRHEEYFEWANQVATQVRGKHSDKLFGFLAYSALSHPPLRTKLDDHLVPYLTYDRMKWADPAIAKADQQLTLDWAQAAPVLGYYDYVFGRQYQVPRVYFHEMARYLRFGAENHVRYYYAEAYPAANWHEGPKLYVLMKLLWNPHLDVDVLLDDWYRAAAGVKAAPLLREYFGLWENFWTRAVPETPWFDMGAMFLHYTNSSYLNAFDPALLDRAADLLDRAHATSEGPQQQRVEFIRTGFREWSRAVRTYGHFRPLTVDGTEPAVVKEVADERLATGLPGWETWQRASSKATFAWNDKTGRTAPGALICGPANSNGTPLLFQTTSNIQPGKTYRVRVWCRSEKLAPEAAEVTLTVKWKTQEGRWATWAPTFIAEPAGPLTGDWQPLEVRFQVSPAAVVRTAVTQLGLRNARSGSVWFDDFSFAETK